MDIISFNEASTANERIRRVNANPDSDSGVVTVPKTIASGETITIPAGRVAVLPNVTVDGDLVIEAGGEVFVPAGAGFNDLDQRIDTLYSTKQDNLVVNDPAVKTALNASGTAPIYACRAWVNFNATGTVAIRASGNVSSITDNFVGNYTVNFTVAMPDVNYSVASSCLTYIGMKPFVSTVNSGSTNSQTTSTTSQVITCGYVATTTGGSLGVDVAEIHVSIFR